MERVNFFKLLLWCMYALGQWCVFIS